MNDTFEPIHELPPAGSLAQFTVEGADCAISNVLRNAASYTLHEDAKSGRIFGAERSIVTRTCSCFVEFLGHDGRMFTGSDWISVVGQVLRFARRMNNNGPASMDAPVAMEGAGL